MEKLYRSIPDKKIGGVCAGFAKYFDVDPTLVRAIYILLTLLSGIIPGVLAYLLLWWLVPAKRGAK